MPIIPRLRRGAVAACALLLAAGTSTGCDYVRLLRPSVLKQVNPDVAQLLDFLPEVDHPNGAVVARLFAHGGLSHATVGSDGVMRDRIRVPRNEYIWRPAIIVMPHGGELELTFANEDVVTHMALLPNDGERMLLELPREHAGRARIRLDQPGMYWFGCPVSNHAGRGMLGLVLVKGEVPAQAKLDRPEQKRPH